MSEAREPVIELVKADIPRSGVATAFAVVRQVDWRIERGSFWAIGAFAGAGKTDLLLATAGLQRPLSGDLLMFGKPVAAMDEQELVSTRLKVAMVFSNGRLFSHLTVAENVALPLRYHGLPDGSPPDELVAGALEKAGIAPLADKLPRQIARAMHQRVALARGLALSPEVLLVDNPLVGADQRGMRWWMDFLCAANAGDPKIGPPLTLVVAADDLRPWIDAAREFGVLRDRRLQTIGGRDEIKKTSENIVRELLTGAFDPV